jgi:hypothetical protein
VILNFGAVDYEATVFLNGRNVTFHRGGFFSFSVDVTKYLNRGRNELYESSVLNFCRGRLSADYARSIVFAFDPTDSDGYTIPVGKQALNPSHIFYRPCSGIWQSVWIESVPRNYINELYIDGSAEGVVNITVQASANGNSSFDVTVYERVGNAANASYRRKVPNSSTGFEQVYCFPHKRD